MKKRGETQEALHPSRDKFSGKGPIEYENLHGRGSDQIYLTGGGVYETSELEHAKEFWIQEGAHSSPEVYAEARHILEPAQGRLFDPAKEAGANRSRLARKRFQTDDVMDPSAKDVRETAMQKSTVPVSDLQPRPGKADTQLIAHNRGKSFAGSGMSGFYSGPGAGRIPDTIAVDPSTGHTTGTLVHEMGHRKHLGEMPMHSDFVNHPQRRYPDPLMEGAADAYEDRYAGPESQQVHEMSKDIEAGKGKFDSYQYTGYSTGPMIAESRGWTPEDRAVYAATRAHGSETGELAHYKPQGRHVMEGSAGRTIEEWDAGEPANKGDPTLDATLHSLIQAGPHAKQALRNTGLKDVGGAMYRRHQDRQLLTQGQEIQGALFDEVREEPVQGQVKGKSKILGYTPSLEALPGTLRERGAVATADMDKFDAKVGPDDIAWPHHMSHNQFGEAPRTKNDVKESLNVSPEHAKQRGFL